MIKRRRTRRVRIGNVGVGGDSPVSVQSMTKTDTSAVDSTLNEIRKLQKAGCDIVRIAVKDRDSVKALKRICERSELPIVADIHFLPQLAIQAIEAGVDAIRLNPGNIRHKNDVLAIIKRAKAAKIPIRIGANSGSLASRSSTIADGMVKSITDYLKIFKQAKFEDIIISMKSPDVRITVEAYRKMAKLCRYPFHLGVTAAGPLVSSTVKSSIAIGTLLQEGIGDTIRVSVTGDSLTEVDIGKKILSTLELRSYGPEVISCPTCGRCEIELCDIVDDFMKRFQDSKLYLRKPMLKVAIMGCVVNGPGEAKDADIGIAGGREDGVLFKRGKKIRRLKQDEFVDALIDEIKAF